ncbi:MAG TPA: NAD(P)-binding domain-containing protein, partial [Burkholderiales bacterium]|nr:NAD(P)-binding domain-containing protein [Burkholderiales bacterium]
MADKRIGFIGVGMMGHGMAKNLAAKGFPTTILGHKNRAPVEDLVKQGATEAKDVASLV